MAYNNQTFTSGQPITANMIDYIDDAVDRLDEIVENIMLAVYPVGSVYLSANNVNPATFFGGTWTLIGTKLAVRENVFGNGKTLGLTNGSSLVGLGQKNQEHYGYDLQAGQSIGTVLPNGYFYYTGNFPGQYIGIPTKSQLGNNPQNSGLIVDTETIYSWKRIA